MPAATRWSTQLFLAWLGHRGIVPDPVTLDLEPAQCHLWLHANQGWNPDTPPPSNERQQRGRFSAEHLVISAQKLSSHLKAMRDHQDNLFWHPASPWDHLMHPPWNLHLHHHGFLSGQQDCLRDISNPLSTAQVLPFYSICHHAGQKCLDHTGRVFVEQDIAVGVSTVKLRSQLPQHSLAKGCECRIEGACAAGDNTVLPEQLWCFRSQPSESVPRIGSPQALPAGLRVLLLLHTNTQTPTGCAPAPFCGSSHRQALGSVITSPAQLLVPQLLCL